MMTPVDTGALRASIHTKAKTGNSVDNAAGALAKVWKKGGIRERRRSAKGTRYASVGERTITDLPEPTGNVRAIIGTGMEYAAYVELGTSKMAARPYLGPAVEGVIAKLNNGATFRRLFE
jgi:HK97 gp10 family phage protein